MVCRGMQRWGIIYAFLPFSVCVPALVDIIWSCPLSSISHTTLLTSNSSCHVQPSSVKKSPCFSLLNDHSFLLFVSSSSLSSKTTRTLLTLSRQVALRPLRKKWRLKMMATWSHTRPRRWWQVDESTQLPFRFSHITILLHLSTPRLTAG